MHDTLQSVLILLAGAVALSFPFRRLGLPPLLGYLLLGMLIGPNALALVPDTNQTRQLAEYGIVFLLFSIGLEFSLPQLAAMRTLVLGFGSAQVALSLAVMAGAAMAFGLGWKAGVTLGSALAMSSTAILAKMLAERLELHSGHGRQIMGVLLFQDLAVIPLLIIVPALSSGPSGIAQALALASVKAAIALIVLLSVGRRLMSGWLHLAAMQKSSELFVLSVLLVTLGLAWASEHAGLSAALGAFLAGMLISETEYRYQVEDAIKPFRDILLGLFFVGIGMLLDVGALLGDLLWVVAALLLLLTIKVAIVFAVGRVLFSNSPATAMRTALALAPAGEFGFVLLARAGTLDLVPDRALQIVLAAALISMLLAPVIVARSERIVLYWFASEWLARAMAVTQMSIRTMETEGHVIVCGYGRSGQNLARFLEGEEIRVVALDIDPQRVVAASTAGDSVVFGDATRRDVLIAAGLHRASAVVVSFSDVAQALHILSHVRDLEPSLPVIVRTHDDTDLDRLRHAGAAEVVPEILEGSLMLASHAMLLLGVPLTRVLGQLREVRRQRYQLMRGFFPGSTDVDEAAHDLSQPRLKSVLLSATAHAVGQTLEELEIEETGAQVTSIRRRDTRVVHPAAETRLEANDVVVLLGTPEALGRAEMRLLSG